MLTAPGPNALQCFGTFAVDIVTLGLTGITSAAAQPTTTAGAVATASTPSAVAGKTVLNTLLGGGTWQVGFGWFGGGDKGMKTYLSYSALNITQASYSFSNIMEKSDNKFEKGNKPTEENYPISGEMDLTFKAQNIFSSSDFLRGYDS